MKIFKFYLIFMEIIQKKFLCESEIELYDFTKFLAWTFLNFLAHCGGQGPFYRKFKKGFSLGKKPNLNIQEPGYILVTLRQDGGLTVASPNPKEVPEWNFSANKITYNNSDICKLIVYCFN